MEARRHWTRLSGLAGLDFWFDDGLENFLVWLGWMLLHLARVKGFWYRRQEVLVTGDRQYLKATMIVNSNQFFRDVPPKCTRWLNNIIAARMDSRTNGFEQGWYFGCNSSSYLTHNPSSVTNDQVVICI